jgi:hypothetical protein
MNEIQEKKVSELKRAWSSENVLKAKFNGLPLDGIWAEVIGQPERAHSWIIWGQSGSGKTTFNMKLARYLGQFERVIYNSMEEGLSKSIQDAYNRAGISPKDRVIMVQENMKQLAVRLSKHKSPNIVFIDSIRYTRMRWDDYQSFCNRFPKKLLIWVAHSKGKEPKGALAEDIRYDAFVKIYTEGYRAFISSRFKSGGDSYMDIWPRGASEYWGEISK